MIRKKKKKRDPLRHTDHFESRVSGFVDLSPLQHVLFSVFQRNGSADFLESLESSGKGTVQTETGLEPRTAIHTGGTGNPNAVTVVYVWHLNHGEVSGQYRIYSINMEHSNQISSH